MIILSLVMTILSLQSCVPTTSSKTRGRSTAAASAGNYTNVPVNYGRVLLDNPAILAKDNALSLTYDLNRLTSTALITSQTFLEGKASCNGLNYCFQVKDTSDSITALQTKDGKWGFSAQTTEFLQVNTYYHLNKMLDQFFTNLLYSKSLTYNSAGNAIYDTAIPKDLFTASGTFKLHTKELETYANCNEADNASYSQADESMCLGYSGSKKELFWAHDSSVIYHETGHFLHRLQINFRNIAKNYGEKSQLGAFSLYNEAGSIGEGLADFYSYYVNGRTHWSEWAAGKIEGSRPLVESDSLHSIGLAESEDARLSYPQYLTYNPNEAAKPFEDVHIAGGIIAHYLVALTKDLESKCTMTNKDAREFVMYILSESLAELGDLTTFGTEKGLENKINLNQKYSKLWFTTVNPINYRSLSQTIAKNLYQSIGTVSLARCNGGGYSKDNIESLLDSYGLLLFKTYNQHRNLTGDIDSSTSQIRANTFINSTNRKKSVLITKSNLILDPTSGASAAFVIDNRAAISSALERLTNTGIIEKLSEQNQDDLSFNNGNGKVSPGEIVAIALNLYNNSNSQMGGIEILANDWDHADLNGKPCQFGTTLSEDQWPLSTEGGSSDASCTEIKAENAVDFAPVCFFQINEANATKWVSQKEFRNKIALDSSYCLDKTNEKDCLFRAVKGMDKARFSKINPKTNWGTTMADPETGKASGFTWGNLLLFEVSKHIPPGTVVNCRMRVRFTNCEDCFHDSNRSGNDYKDSEYNGPRPFKTIHLQIPITD